MTDTRDDIAGLCERLLAEIGQPVIYRNDATLREAATQLDSLLKERDALQARVKELEGDFAKLTDMAKKSEDLRGKALHAAEQWQDRATRLQQERDEAYERAAQIAIDVCNTQAAGWKRDPGEDRCGEVAASNCGLFAAQAIRRLAAGPEKEKKE